MIEVTLLIKDGEHVYSETTMELEEGGTPIMQSFIRDHVLDKLVDRYDEALSKLGYGED